MLIFPLFDWHVFSRTAFEPRYRQHVVVGALRHTPSHAAIRGDRASVPRHAHF
jgi:hypothetical protein